MEALGTPPAGAAAQAAEDSVAKAEMEDQTADQAAAADMAVMAETHYDNMAQAAEDILETAV